ncbi:MAG: FtsK/SpoIIIE domain-containing protein [Candidatus Aphodocola sp.]
MDGLDKDIEELIRSLFIIIKDFIVGIAKGIFYGTKKLRNRKLLLGSLINFLIPLIPLFKNFSIISNLKINNTTNINNTVLDYLIFFVISFILYLNIISGSGGNKKLSAALETAGIVGQDGRPPMLLYKYKDNVGYEIYKFRGLVKFSEWKKKKEDIETNLNISIKEIKQGKRKDEVILKTVPGVLVMPGGTGEEKTEEERKKVTLYWNDNVIKEKDNLVSIGRNEVEEIVVDFDADPHFLVAGATGSGKSVTIRSIVWQFLVRGHKGFFVDFKGGLEYSDGYKRYGETIIDRPKLLEVLKTLVKENELRQKALLEVGAKNINQYNKKSSKKMYRVLLVIDELAEVIDPNSVPKEEKEIADEITGILSSFGRVARATGIHMIFGIQRPDANVVNGQIRSNVTGRICGRVPSGKASEIVLDDPSAASLPKVKGRMIYQNAGEMIEFQGYFFDDDKDLRKVKVPSDRLLVGGDVGCDDGEELYPRKVNKKQKKFNLNPLIEKLKDKIKIFKFKRKTKENEIIEDDILAEDNLDEFESGIINWTSEKRDMENKAEVKKSTISNEMDDYYID